MGMELSEKAAYDGVKNSKCSIDIITQSNTNLVNLKSKLSPLDKNESDFKNMCMALPLILEHRSSSAEDAGWQKIKGHTKQWGGIKNQDADLLSLFGLAKFLYGAKGEKTFNNKKLDTLTLKDVTWKDVTKMLGRAPKNTSSRDFENFGNIDFVFYKLNVAGRSVNLNQGYSGVSRGKPKFFSNIDLYKKGWISLDDWVSHSGGQKSFTKQLLNIWWGLVSNGLTVVYEKNSYKKTYSYKCYETIADKAFEQRNYQKVKQLPNIITKLMKEEVFFGPDIKEGLALTLIEHMRAADPTHRLVLYVVRMGNSKIADLMNTIWMLIEAKLPCSMKYYQFKISKQQAIGKK